MPVHDLAWFLVVDAVALFANTPMCFGRREFGAAAVRAPARLALELALPRRQQLFRLMQVAGIVNVATVGQCGDALQAHVNGRVRAIGRVRLRRIL
jgi:hypothetical protein